MSSGPDDGYRMECEARDVKALQRKHATGPLKRRLVKKLTKARKHLADALESLTEFDDQDEAKRAFLEEADGVDVLVRRLDQMVQNVESMGVDLKEVARAHAHSYSTDDLDEGCAHCGVSRRTGKARGARG